MSFFVTGTDTGIGKTVTATVLSRGLAAAYWKPIQTGASEGTDADFARRWLPQQHVLPEAYVFEPPVSPHFAAAMADRRIDLDVCVDVFARYSGQIVVEGAGGVLVPIDDDVLMIDLMERLRLPIIVVAGTQLGTINHTLMTLAVLRERRLEVRGLVVNGIRDPALEATFERRGGVPIVGRVEPCAAFSPRWFDETFAGFDLRSYERGGRPCASV